MITVQRCKRAATLLTCAPARPSSETVWHPSDDPLDTELGNLWRSLGGRTHDSNLEPLRLLLAAPPPSPLRACMPGLRLANRQPAAETPAESPTDVLVGRPPLTPVALGGSGVPGLCVHSGAAGLPGSGLCYTPLREDVSRHGCPQRDEHKQLQRLVDLVWRVLPAPCAAKAVAREPVSVDGGVER